MQLEHWIISGLAVAGLLFTVVWFVWLGRRYRWPPGTRKRAMWAGYEVHVIAPPEMVSHTLVRACAQAVAATAKGWVLAGNGNSTHEKLGEVAVYFAPSAHFNNDDFLVNAAAYLSAVQRSVGGGMPCAVIRAEPHYFEQVDLSGEPVIHEMLHCLSVQFSDWRKDRAHSDPRVWKAVGGESSAQHLARAEFRRLAGT